MRTVVADQLVHLPGTTVRRLPGAIAARLVGVVQWLLANRYADVNAPTDDGLTPLALAMAANTPSIVRLLLDAGADYTAPCPRDNHTALEIGVLTESYEATVVLLDHIIRLNAPPAPPAHTRRLVLDAELYAVKA